MVTGVLDHLKQAVLDYDAEAAANWAKQAMEEGVDPIAALDALTEAIRVIGDGFGRQELWLPDLLGGSEAMLAATPILEAEIQKRGAERASLGTIVIGTVFGDIHNIGKAMVATLLTAEGFRVHDLGVNIIADDFVKAVKEHNADLLALSALMTTTASQQIEVIRRLKEEGLRDTVKVIIGGGGVTQEFADQIGADGYDPTAPGAVKLAWRLLGGAG
jgi:corrinoid protein of di/trimethylamine methyltransferase